MGGIKDWRSILGTPWEASNYSWLKLSGSAATSQIATVNYSSGTTGLPKGVEITHGNLIANVEQVTFSAQVENPRVKLDIGSKMDWLSPSLPRLRSIEYHPPGCQARDTRLCYDKVHL